MQMHTLKASNNDWKRSHSTITNGKLDFRSWEQRCFMASLML